MIPLKFKKPPKEPDAAQDLRAKSRAGMLTDELFGFVSSINIDAGFSVVLLNWLYLL